MKYLLVIFTFTTYIHSLWTKEISISFDDAPRASDEYFSAIDRSINLVEALKKSKVERVAFYCNTARFDKSGIERIKIYSAAGHLLANHTHSHMDLDSTNVQEFIADFNKADSLLKKLHGFIPWFRFPFLREGNTISKRDKMRKHLKNSGYTNGYVTIDNYDWYMNILFKKALRAKKIINYKKLKQIYISTLISGVEFYDNIALKAIGRSPKHVLLLHENDLAAMYISDLIKELRLSGWKIITPEESYDDPISKILPDTLFNSQGRVAAIAETKGFQKKELIHESEDKHYLDKVFLEKRVFANPN